MRRTLSLRLWAAVSGCLLLAGVSMAGTAHAQVPDARWLPWMGCWTSSTAAATSVPTTAGAGGVVCVLPASSGPGVVVATIANDRVVHTESINATGARSPKTLEDCPGWESATWSADGHRVLLRSEFACSQEMTVKGSGVFSISADGAWLQVQGSTVGRNTGAYVVRYRPTVIVLADVSAGVLADSTPVRLVTAATGLAARSAREAAGEVVSPDAVLEVTRHVEGPVAEAWVNEIGQRFAVDAKDLVRLADAGMPSPMIDLLVALSYPERFVLQRQAIVSSSNAGGGGASGNDVGALYAGSIGRRWDCGYGSRLLAYGYYGDSCYPGYYGLSGYGAYGYGGHGYNGYGYGYNGYGQGYYGGQQPIIVVPRNNPNPEPRGRAVNGAGYTRGTSNPPRPSTSTPDRSTSGSSSGSTSGSSGSSSGSGSTAGSTTGSSTGSSSGSAPRTAQPRVPPG